MCPLVFNNTVSSLYCVLSYGSCRTLSKFEHGALMSLSAWPSAQKSLKSNELHIVDINGSLFSPLLQPINPRMDLDLHISPPLTQILLLPRFKTFLSSFPLTVFDHPQKKKEINSYLSNQPAQFIIKYDGTIFIITSNSLN